LAHLAKLLLESQGYEVHLAGDGFEGLIALKQSLPDIIISDLAMPNMNGFEFLSVVRRRFPVIPIIVISGEFSSITVPESVLADAFFGKGQYKPETLFARIIELLREIPPRPRIGKPDKAAVWVKMAKVSLL
jgi:CheY-like chemotaxis protein